MFLVKIVVKDGSMVVASQSPEPHAWAKVNFDSFTQDRACSEFPGLGSPFLSVDSSVGEVFSPDVEIQVQEFIEEIGAYIDMLPSGAKNWVRMQIAAVDPRIDEPFLVLNRRTPNFILHDLEFDDPGAWTEEFLASTTQLPAHYDGSFYHTIARRIGMYLPNGELPQPVKDSLKQVDPDRPTITPALSLDTFALGFAQPEGERYRRTLLPPAA